MRGEVFSDQSVDLTLLFSSLAHTCTTKQADNMTKSTSIFINGNGVKKVTQCPSDVILTLERK